jgi:hypothetical protein
MKTERTIDLADMHSDLNLAEETAWASYCHSLVEGKGIQVAVGQRYFRVFHGNVIIYEGPLMELAVRIYNTVDPGIKRTLPNLFFKY